MLVSVVIDPACFTPEELCTPEAQAGAECILEAATENAIIVAPSIDPFITQLLDGVARLEARAGQQIQISATELAKNSSRLIAVPRPAVPILPDAQQIHLPQLAINMRADALVIRRNENLPQPGELSRRGIEVCRLDGYRSSQTERRRKAWRAGQRLDSLSPAQSGELLGRSIKYADEILFLDKMIAKSGKDGAVKGKLCRFVRGVVHVARQWQNDSPLSASTRPSIVIVSSAGQCGASAGFVDPAKAETAIRAALALEDKTHLIQNLTIDLRQEGEPAVFNDRFLAGFGRCFSIGHGLDDIGNLADPKAKKRPTTLAPDCQAYRDILAEIRRLPKA